MQNCLNNKYLLTYIVSFLDIESQKDLCLVCKRWKGVIDPIYHRNVIFKNPKAVERIQDKTLKENKILSSLTAIDLLLKNEQLNSISKLKLHCIKLKLACISYIGNKYLEKKSLECLTKKNILGYCEEIKKLAEVIYIESSQNWNATEISQLLEEYDIASHYFSDDLKTAFSIIPETCLFRSLLDKKEKFTDQQFFNRDAKFFNVLLIKLPQEHIKKSCSFILDPYLKKKLQLLLGATSVFKMA